MNYSDWTEEEAEIWIDALKRSITDKWQPIVKGKEEDKGAANCRLCLVSGSCEGCPVFIDTGERQCMDTPYADWSDYWWSNQKAGFSFLSSVKLTPWKVRTEQEAELAQAELDYLKGLYKRLTGGRI